MSKTTTMPTHQLMIPNTILVDNNLTHAEKLILGEIIWLQNHHEKKTGEAFCYPSNFYLQCVFNYKSERGVILVLNSLANKGYIRILKNPHSNYRRLKYNFDKCFERDVIIGLVKPQ